MYFNDRIALGETLAGGLKEMRHTDAVILCLSEASLLTCLSMAMRLRAWVLPLVFEPIHNPASAQQLVGAIDRDGNFIPHPMLEDMDEARRAAVDELVSQQKTATQKLVQKRFASYDMKADYSRLEGRNIILVSDVLTDPLALVVAEKVLPRTRIKSLAIAIGNASPDVATLARISAPKVVILDVISGIPLNPDTYFSQPDPYDLDQKHTLTKHIATYWQ